MTDAENVAADAFDDVAEIAAKRAREANGLKGAALAGAANVLKAAAEAIRSRGETPADILAKVKAPRDVTFPWDETPPATPGAKRGSGQQ